MAKIVNIICDYCGSDISTTTNIVDYRLELSAVSIPNNSGRATLLHKTPPIDSDKVFCGKRCLANWLVDSLGKDYFKDL